MLSFLVKKLNSILFQTWKYGHLQKLSNLGKVYYSGLEVFNEKRRTMYIWFFLVVLNTSFCNEGCICKNVKVCKSGTEKSFWAAYFIIHEYEYFNSSKPFKNFKNFLEATKKFERYINISPIENLMSFCNKTFMRSPWNILV